jgi:hypothetical protein
MSSPGAEQGQQALAIVQAMVDKSIEAVVTPLAADLKTAVREIRSLRSSESLRGGREHAGTQPGTSRATGMTAGSGATGSGGATSAGSGAGVQTPPASGRQAPPGRPTQTQPPSSLSGVTPSGTEVFRDLATPKSENRLCACAVFERSKESSGKDRFSLFWKLQDP